MSLLAAIVSEERAIVYQSVPLIVMSRIRINQSKRNIFPDDIFHIIILYEMREKSCMMAMPIGTPPGILKEQGEDYDGRKD